MDAVTPKRILVVDDEEAVAEVLQYLLEDEGYEVVTATVTEDALAKAADGGFAAAVLDFSMGQVTSVAVAQALKSDPSTADVPIIILTGVSERTVREQFTGYDLFVSKGADLSEFATKLATLVGAREADKQSTREQRPDA